MLALYREEKPYLTSLPLESFRYFSEESRTVDDSGLIVVEQRYYPALPAAPRSQVTVRIYEREIEILDAHGTLLRRHEKKAERGRYELPPEDRLFNPSRETARLLAKAVKIGPNTAKLAREIFARLGRPGQKAIYGLTNLARHHTREDIERACARTLKLSQPSYQALKRILTAIAAERETAVLALEQHGAHIRAVEEYQRFFDQHTALINDLSHPP